MIKIILVDDHDIVRTGVKKVLEGQSGFQVVGEAGSGDAAVELAKKVKFDIILMDLQMPGLGGIEATRKIIRNNSLAKVIVLTTFDDTPFPKQLLEIGAKGYLTKGCAAEELLIAIRQVHSGQRYINPETAQKLALSMMGGETTPFDELSAREMEVMMLILQGMDNNGMSEKLSISPKTVSTYRYRIYEKLDVKNDIEMVKVAIAHGMLEGNEGQ
ncbi:MAG: response regulator [bacterium]